MFALAALSVTLYLITVPGKSNVVLNRVGSKNHGIPHPHPHGVV